MITAVDTNVLLDVVVPEAPDANRSIELLSSSLEAGLLIICEIVYAELAAVFTSEPELDQFLARGDIRVIPSARAALSGAGRAWRAYSTRRPRTLTCPGCGLVANHTCQRCRRSLVVRQHLLADFAIGAHALAHANRLLSRDRGFYKTYFPELAVLA